MKLFLLFLIFIYTAALQADDSALQADDSVDRWISSKLQAERIASDIKNGIFDIKFPSSTIEEIEETLSFLKRGFRWIKSERMSNFLLFFPTGTENRQIRLFRSKIRELKQKRKDLIKSRACRQAVS